MHWRIGTFVELEHLSDEDRDRLLNACGGRRTIGMMIVRSALFGVVFGYFAARLFGGRLPMEMFFGLFGLATILGAVFVYQVQIIRLHGALGIFLDRMAREEQLPMCLRCGYSREGLSSDRCPECGFPIAADPSGS